MKYVKGSTYKLVSKDPPHTEYMVIFQHTNYNGEWWGVFKSSFKRNSGVSSYVTERKYNIILLKGASESNNCKCNKTDLKICK